MVIRVEKMRKQILIAGIVLLIIGLIMWFIGGMGNGCCKFIK
jgi:Flp pilus assembly protein protease CpaA